MALLRLLPIALVAFLPLAAAQTEPTSDVTITLGETESTIEPGGNLTVSVSVELEIANVVCTAETDATVTLEVDGSAVGVTVEAESDSLSYAVPQGPHFGGQAFSDDQATELVIMVTPTNAGNMTAYYNVTASYAGNTCTGTGQVPDASDTEALVITIPAAMPTDGEGDGDDGDGEGGGGGGGKGAPGPALPLLLGVLAIAAVLRRRNA